MGNKLCHSCDKELPKSSSDHDQEIDRLVDKVKATIYTPEDGTRPYYEIKESILNPKSLSVVLSAGAILGPIGLLAAIPLLFKSGEYYCFECFWKPKLEEEERRRVDQEGFDKELIDKQAMHLEYLEWLNESKGYSNPYLQPYKNPSFHCACKDISQSGSSRTVQPAETLSGDSMPHPDSLPTAATSPAETKTDTLSLNPKDARKEDSLSQELPQPKDTEKTNKQDSMAATTTLGISQAQFSKSPTEASRESTSQLQLSIPETSHAEKQPQYFKLTQAEQKDRDTSTKAVSNEQDTPSKLHGTQYNDDKDTHDDDEDELPTLSSENSVENFKLASDGNESDSEEDYEWEDSEEDSEWEESEDDDDTEGEDDLTNDYEKLSKLLDEVIETQPSNNIVCNRDFQASLQLCLLSCYDCVYDLSDIEFDVIASELAAIGSKLSDSELFSLSKVLSLLCKEILSKNQPSSPHSVPTTYPDITDQFLYDLTLATNKSGSKACLEACLGEFISHRLKCTTYTSVIRSALVTTVTTSLWTVQDVLSLLENRALINNDHTFLRMVELALINQIGFKRIQSSLDTDFSTVIDILQRSITEDKSDRSVEQIVSVIAKTNLIDSNTLKQAGEIVDSLLKNLNEDTFSMYKSLTNRKLASLMRQYMYVPEPGNQICNRQLVLVLNYLCCGVREHTRKKYFPTNAQLVALCILIHSHQNKPQTNRLLEVLSGEGKSTIIAMFAAFLCLQGYRVDIITSSPELAQRDSTDWKTFFKSFNLTSAHNTETEELLSMRQEQADKERVNIYEEHDVVYGTVGSFSADYLRQEFEMRTIRPKRPYRVAIVDEVDMLMLDEGVQFTYLSHQAPVLRHIEPVLALVWSSVCQNTPLVTSTGATLFAGVPKLIHNIIFEGINRALCGGLSDSRQLLHVAVQDKIIDQDELQEIFQATDTESQQAAMEIFTTNKMIQLVSCLQDNYLPYKFKVFVLSSISGELQETTLFTQTSTPSKESDIKRPEFSLLIMDKGSACPLYDQKKLSVAVEKMVSSQCDIPLHNSTSASQFLRAKDGQKYFEGVTSYFHDVIYSAITKRLKLKFETSEQILDLAVTYNTILESDVTQLLHAKDDQTKKLVMEKLGSSHLCKFIEKLNKDLPFSLLPFELREGVLVPKLKEMTKSHVKELRVPVLVKEQGLICPLYPYEWIAEKSEMLHTKDGTCYWVGEPAFFHETIFQSLSSKQILYYAINARLVEETGVKQFLEAKDRANKRKALEKCTETQIQTLLNCLESGRSFSILLYTTKDQSSLELISKEKRVSSPSDSKLLFKENGMLCQLHLKQTVQIPEFMKEFVSIQLPTYVQSAFTALSMTEEREYLVTELGRIAPIDFQNTGVIERNKRWGGGLQQMLEMKHFLELSPITVITNFISHVKFFKLYEALYGLSGTIGLKQEQDMLRNDAMYNLHSCQIPTSKQRKSYECRTVTVGNRDDWKNEIYLRLEEVTSNESKRAALVLCEDICTAKELEQFLDKEKHVKHLTPYYGPGNRKFVNSHTFVSGDIIIATNLAGRGTDIKVSQEVNDCGGLFCLVTFLPRNDRVEMQAFGRTARCGNPGSAQLILLASSLPQDYQHLHIKDIRALRALQETQRLTSMVNHDVQEVMLRDDLFAKHCQYIHRVQDHFHKDKNVSVIIESINEEWGQWLQTKQALDQERGSLITDLKRIHSRWDTSLQMQNRRRTKFNIPVLVPGGNFIHLIKLGNRLAKSGRKGQTQAIKCYCKAIDVEKQFTLGHQSKYTAIAYYNHAYCEINVHGDKDDKTDDERTQIRSFILKAKDLLQVYVEETNVVLQCVKTNGNEQRKANSDFAKQMEVRLQVLEFAAKKIAESHEELEQLKKNGEHDIEAVPSSIFQLIPNPDIVTEEELLGLAQLGLEFVFEVKKKPRFCWEGLVVFVLGIAEIAVGVCLIVLTAGIGSEIGGGLIAEGVSDCIDGTIGMITGDWSWSQWATMKACSIAVSLATGGVGEFVKIAQEGEKLAQIGAKELPKLVELGSEEATKLTLKDAGKVVGKEIVQQSVMRGLGELENIALEKIVHKIAEHVTEKSGIKKSLEIAFRGENPLGLVIDQKFALRLPPGYRVDDKMSPVLEKEAIDFFSEVVNSVVASLVSQSEMFGQVMTTLSDLIHGISGKLKGKGPGLFHLLEVLLAGESVIRAEVQLDKLFSHFEERIEDYCKDPNQAKQVTKLKIFLAKHSAFAASEALASEIKQSAAKMIKDPLNEEQNEALNNVTSEFAEKASAYLETALTKSFSSDQKLGRVVSIMFVAPYAVKGRNDSASLPCFKKATSYFETAVHEVVVGLFTDSDNDSKHTDFQDVVHSMLALISKTPVATPAEATTDYVSKLKHTLDCIPHHLYSYCEKYVNSVQEPHAHIQRLTRHLADFNLHSKLHDHCQQFFEGSDNIAKVTSVSSSEPSKTIDIKELKCVVALKKKLVQQTVESFTQAVSTVLLQNLGWIANQALNRTVNGALAHHISEPRKTLKAVRKKARDVGHALSSIVSSEMTPYKVEYQGKALFNSTIPLSEAELKVAAHLNGRQIELIDRFGHKRIIEPVSKDKSTEELPKVSLKEDEEGKYSLANDSEHKRYELLEALSHGLNRSKSPEHHLDQSQLRQAIAEELTNSPKKWTEHYETERMRDNLQPHIAKILDSNSFGTAFETKVEEEVFKIGITIVDKDGKVLRQSERKDGEQITLIHIKDEDHPEGHYDRQVDGEHIKVHSDYGNCHYDAISEEVNRLQNTSTQFDGNSVRRAVAAEIASNPRKWHEHYRMKRKIERSWFKRRRLLKGGANSILYKMAKKAIKAKFSKKKLLWMESKLNTLQEGKLPTVILRNSGYHKLVKTQKGQHVDHVVELQQFKHELIQFGIANITPEVLLELRIVCNSKDNLQALDAKENREKSKYISKALKLEPDETSLGDNYDKQFMISTLETNIEDIQRLITEVDDTDKKYSEVTKMIVKLVEETAEKRLKQLSTK